MPLRGPWTGGVHAGFPQTQQHPDGIYQSLRLVEKLWAGVGPDRVHLPLKGKDGTPDANTLVRSASSFPWDKVI